MIFLDNNSTTRPNEDAVRFAIESTASHFYNPSAPYADGSRALLEDSREKIAKSIGCEYSNIVFTSGGTEANNIAMHAIPEIGEINFCTEVEHASVYNCAIEKIKVTSEGFIDLNHLEEILKRWEKWAPRKILGVMSANNETGIITDPTNDVPGLCEKYKVFLHVDAVQSLGKIPNFSVLDLKADTVAFSGHKIHALKGIGALYIRDGHKVTSLMKGGHHEFSVRPGTENQIGIQSFGFVASKFLDNDHFEKLSILSRNRDLFEDLLKDVSSINGNKEFRLCNTSNLYFPDISDSDIFVDELYENGIVTSTRSACSSGMPVPSRTLSAMFGVDDPRTTRSVRFSLSIENTEEEIRKASDIIKDTLLILKKKGV